jgi:hypothetical protein
MSSEQRELERSLDDVVGGRTLQITNSSQFLTQSNEVDEVALENLWKRGREAWRDVASATDWVESLRGNS